MPKKITAIKEHLHRNRAKYAFAAGFLACYAITNRARNEWNEFLEERGLTDEFYLPEE